ncbi:MAG: carbohydrate-binding domain-containing protein [Ruminococcus sp.]|nr:carbohydrate-binding domain-containing protein [Ruminococcus sp.]
MKKNAKKLLAGISSICVMAASVPAVTLTAQAFTYDNVNVHYGDANLDNNVNLNDAVAILQYAALPAKYSLTDEALNNADVYKRGDGVSGMDALAIQWVDAGVTLEEGDFAGQTATEETLPISWLNGKPSDVDPVTDIIYIHLNGSSISVEGDSSGYTAVSGSTVTISHSGTFYVDGTLDDGQINVNIADEVADPETVKIFLNGATIYGKSSPAILVTNAENTSINLVDGTTNTISDGDTAYAGDFLGAAVIEAKDDLTIKGGDLGTGTLELTANTQDGIVCNNDLKINGGIINVTTLNATDGTNGLNGKTSLTVKSGTLTVDAEGDGIKSGKGNVDISGGTVAIKAGKDAVQSGTTIDISGGTVIAGGDRGLTSTTGVNITGGTVIATATDYQTDAALLTSTNQAAMLLNCVADPSNTDGCWKKANALTTAGVTADKWQKKYQYVLISDPSITTGQTYTLKNASTGATATHSNDIADTFAVTNSVTTFDTVNPAGKDGTVTVDPITTDGYTITFASNGASTNAPSDVATVSNGVVTISKESTFAVTGNSTSGQIVVDVDKTAYPNSVVELDLTGVELSNSTTAPIYVASIGDEVQIVSKKDTVNVISDGTSHTQTYTDSDGNTNTVEGAIFSRDDLKFKGSGSLTVNGNTDDAIVCKNDIKIYNGSLTVNAVDDGIRGKDSVTIGDTTKSDGSAADNSGISVTVKTQYGDGIKSTATDTATDKSYGVVTINGGTVNISSYADGIQAEQEFIMNGGDVTISTYQGSSYTGSGSSSSGSTNPWGGPGFGMGQDGNSNKTDISAKGIKAVGLYDAAGTTWQSKGNLTVNGGTITIDSSDDCVHCGGDMFIYGGVFKVASADDGFHSDHNLTIGKTVANTFDDVQIFVSKCYEGVEAPVINQNSGSVYIISEDDGYNAGGGADSSGTGNPGGPGGGWSQGTTTSTNIAMNLNGGLVVVNSANGDHDAFDSNANIYVNGGYYCANGQEPLDCGDNGNSISMNGGTVISMTAGNTSLNTRYTFVDSSGKAIISFLSGSGGGLRSGSSASAQSGGSVSGGTAVLEQAGSYSATVGGTISGGSTLGQASESQGPGGRM